MVQSTHAMDFLVNCLIRHGKAIRGVLMQRGCSLVSSTRSVVTRSEPMIPNRLSRKTARPRPCQPFQKQEGKPCFDKRPTAASTVRTVAPGLPQEDLLLAGARPEKKVILTVEAARGSHSPWGYGTGWKGWHCPRGQQGMECCFVFRLPIYRRLWESASRESRCLGDVSRGGGEAGGMGREGGRSIVKCKTVGYWTIYGTAAGRRFLLGLIAVFCESKRRRWSANRSEGGVLSESP
ncbi:hypothetical protein BJ875DRAFT_110427 [Amylocarpus encephaloides]|uniref:Uncharacterized protein n=1 Tax=Amylocarpus encephaloides TaxID=45428 RepID=A0A9P8C2M3_9HELO|nr:hypothetical protein BJ875DRAFT_110427 [Amylocarpus encephaloides]